MKSRGWRKTRGDDEDDWNLILGFSQNQKEEKHDRKGSDTRLSPGIGRLGNSVFGKYGADSLDTVNFLDSLHSYDHSEAEIREVIQEIKTAIETDHPFEKIDEEALNRMIF